MNAVVLDAHTLNPGDLSWAPIEALASLTVYPRTRPEDIAERASEADIVLTNKVPLDEETLAQLPRLSLICEMATGYNNIDIEAAKRRGIVVQNIPAYSTQSVAQMVFAHLLAITNRVEHYTRETKRKAQEGTGEDFCFWDTPLSELAGKTLAIVSLGRIGTQVARVAEAFGMRVIALTTKSQSELSEGITKVESDRLFREADVLTLHCPLTRETHHLVGRHTLALMKPEAIIINTSRGPVVDEAALAQALSEGRIAAYGADVLQDEPMRPDNPLLTAPGVFLTPHIAWATPEARRRLMQTLEENIRSFVEGKPIHVVNR